MEKRDASPPTPKCPDCGCKECKPKYNNNKKVEQPRVECLNCHRLYQLHPQRKVHPGGYKKKKVEEPLQYQNRIKQCDACGGTNVKFYSLNNNDNFQPRYKCKNPKCKKVFTPFKKNGESLKEALAPVENVVQPTTSDDITTEIDSLHMSRDFYDPLLLANEIPVTWGGNSGLALPDLVNNNGDTSYSSAPDGTGCSIQIAHASLYIAPNNRACNSIATYNNTSGDTCGLNQYVENVYQDSNIYNTGISTHDQYGGGGGSRVYQHDIPKMPPTQPHYPIYNNLPASTNIQGNTPTEFLSVSNHTSLFTNVPQTLHEDVYNMQMNSGKTHMRYAALRLPPPNSFSGSIYQAPKGGMHEGYTNNNVGSQSNNLQQLGNGGAISQNCGGIPPLNRPPYK